MYIYIYLSVLLNGVSQTMDESFSLMKSRLASKGCVERHSHTTAPHPVLKPPAVVSTTVSHTPTQKLSWGNYQELSCSLSRGMS